MKYCVYKIATGEIVQRFSTSIAQISNQLGPDEGFYLGDADDVRFRVDHDTGELFEYIPPSPGDDFVFNRDHWSWVLSDQAQKVIDDDKSARKELDALDLSAVRYLLEKDAGVLDKEGEQRLADILEKKAELRGNLISQKASK